MRTLIFFFVLIATMSSRADASIETKTLMKGQSTTVNVEFEIGDAAVADRTICDYLVGQDRRSVYLSAQKPGETTVTLWDSEGKLTEDFNVKVVTTTLKETLDRARQEFGDLDGINVEVRGGRVEVTGEVAEPEDFRIIEQGTRKDPRIRSRVNLAAGPIEEQAAAIRTAIAVPGVSVRAVRDRIVMEGVAYSQADAKRAVEIAKLYSPEVLDLIDVRDSKREIGRARLVELTFHMIEIKKSALRELGLNWAPGSFSSAAGGASAGGAGILSSLGGIGREVLGFVFQLVPRLKFIRERGDAQVLENPSVIVKSGEDAKIFSGSEVPYYKGQDVQFKKVGVDIDVTPVEVDGGVDIRLSATLSSPTSDLRGAIDTHTISTSAICPFGQSLAIGNIVRGGEVKMRNRTPQGVDISSALFTLFLSKDFQSNKSEFIIFVTPRLVTEASELPSLEVEMQKVTWLNQNEKQTAKRGRSKWKWRT